MSNEPRFLTVKLEEKTSRRGDPAQRPRCLVLDPQGGILGQLPVANANYNMRLDGLSVVNMDLFVGDLSIQSL